MYGLLPGIFREGQHYGASLNAIPILDAYREDPANFYLLRAGYAAANGVLANIDEQGRASMLFSADPAVHDYDPFSGDYGCAFFGHAHNAGAYVIEHPEFGWLGFGCDVASTQDRVTIIPRDAFRRRVFLAPFGLLLSLESGRVEQLSLHPAAGRLDVVLAAASTHTPVARLRVEDTVGSGSCAPMGDYQQVREAWEIVLGDTSTTLTIHFEVPPVF